MNLKPVIALVLGLIFQLAQIMPAATVDAPCAAHGESCCCGSGASCHCADRGDTESKPRPAPATSAETLKVSLARLSETKVPLVTVLKMAAPVMVRPQLPEVSASGYSGVRLSVAFCSFVM